MKRSATTSAKGEPKAKKAREDSPPYHETPSLVDPQGEIIWPAPKDDVETARRIIRECAAAGKRTLIVPDKDADGLTSGVILYKTLVLLGLPPEMITPQILKKGTTVHSLEESERMASHDPAYIFVLDQGSRSSPPLIPTPHTCLVIDHHQATPHDFPEGSHHINACNTPPVATSSLLTYEICRPLHPDVATETAWLCLIGTHGDLGASIQWKPPFPDMAATIKRHTKKAITEAVSLLNAPRRTATFDVSTAWDALMAAAGINPVGPGEAPTGGAPTTEVCWGPKALNKSPRLAAARREIAAEVERCTHTAPKFTKDGRVAVFHIDSAAQVHPLIATRWANHLASKALEVVMCANAGHMEGRVNFSCRVARVARARRAMEGREGVDIITLLKEYAGRHGSGTLVERLGEDFARGHRQASGGIVAPTEFQDLMDVMEVGVKPDKAEGSGVSPKKKASYGVEQKNKLTGYFGKK